MTPGNDPYPPGARVLTRYPAPGMTAADPREGWPWLPGVVEQRCAEDEWLLTVTAPEVGELEDGSPAPPGTPEQDVWHPGCFRNACEIRPAARREDVPGAAGDAGAGCGAAD